jgi:AcrR family transcriptional regulator
MPAHSHTSSEAIVAAGRSLLEERGLDALTMQGVAAAVGVRAPSLYKHVRSRSELVQLLLENVADELTAALDAAAVTGDPAADLRAMAATYRGYAHAYPVAYTLLHGPQLAPGQAGQAVSSPATLLRVAAELAGPQHALPAAHTVAAWAHGFITMELAGAFCLGDDVEQAWDFGLDQILAAVRRGSTAP